METLSIVESKNGYKVIKRNDLYLSSRVDPIREAEYWLEENTRKFDGVDFVFVLGVGGGYQARELALKYPEINVYVLEKNRELIEAVKVLIGPIENLNYIFIENTNQIAALLDEIPDLNANLSVLRIDFSYRNDPEFYSEIHQFLTARNSKGLNYFLNREYSVAFNTEDFIVGPKDLFNTLAAHPSRKIKHITKVLGELIK